METVEKTQDLLAKIRTAKEAKELSYQAIADITARNGEAVSKATVARVLQPDAKIEDFRYNQTIRPILRAVLGMDEETEAPVANSPEQSEQYYATIEAMKSLIDYKHQQLAERSAEADKLRAELKSIQARQRAELERIERSEREQEAFLQQIVDDMKGSIKWYKKVVAILAACVLLVTVVLIVSLIAR